MDVIGVTREMTADLVERAYRTGVFPMAAPEHGVITWHRPDPRAIIPLQGLHIPRRLARTMRSRRFEVTFDRDFPAVMRGCAEGRPVWISEDFHRIYGDLHKQGKAHSVEVWSDAQLVGGLYGVHLGSAFFAESKFHRKRDASKVALAALASHLRERGFGLLEVQYLTEHLAQFGTVEVRDHEYVRLLRAALAVERQFA